MTTKKILSVEIGSSITRVCEVDYCSKKPRVYNQFILDTPEGVMEDGMLKATPDFISEFKSALYKNRMKAKKIVFTITSTKIASRELIIPKIREKKIGALVAANASDYFPVDIEEYELAHSLLGTIKDEKGSENFKIMVLAASKVLLNPYEKFAEALGMSVLSIDYGGNSLYQMIKTECDQESTMVIKVDEAASLVVVTDNQSMVLQRTVSYGINGIIETFKDAMGRHWDNSSALKELEKKNYLSPYSYDDDDYYENEASDKENSAYGKEEEDLGKENPYTHLQKNEDGLQILDIEGMSNGPESRAELQVEDEESAQQTLERQLTEAFSYALMGIARIYDYQNSRNPERPITKVYLTGSGAGIKGLSNLLSKHLGIPVSILKLKGEFRFHKRIAEGEADVYAGCLGASLAPLGFTPIRTENKKGNMAGKAGRKNGGSIIFLAGAVVVSLVLIVASAVPYGMAYFENKNKRIAIEQLSQAVPVYQEYVLTKNAANYLKSAYEQTVLPTEKLTEFIMELEAKLPRGVYLSNFTADKAGISFNVIATTKIEAADLVLQLKSMTSLTGVSVSSITDTREEGDEGRVEFSLTANFVDGKADEEQAPTMAISQEIEESEISE